MCRKLRCIHTLNGCNAIAEISAMCYKHRVFENVSSFVLNNQRRNWCLHLLWFHNNPSPSWYLYSLKHSLVPCRMHSYLSCEHIPYHGQPKFNSYFYFIANMNFISIIYRDQAPGHYQYFFQ